jgi:hypothetical protein
VKSPVGDSGGAAILTRRLPRRMRQNTLGIYAGHMRHGTSVMITEIRISTELSTAYRGAYFRLEASFRDQVWYRGKKLSWSPNCVLPRFRRPSPAVA